MDRIRLSSPGCPQQCARRLRMLDPIRSRPHRQRLAFPAQSHEAFGDQPIDSVMNNGHGAPPVRKIAACETDGNQGPGDLAWADRGSWVSVGEQSERAVSRLLRSRRPMTCSFANRRHDRTTRRKTVRQHSHPASGLQTAKGDRAARHLEWCDAMLPMRSCRLTPASRHNPMLSLTNLDGNGGATQNGTPPHRRPFPIKTILYAKCEGFPDAGWPF